MSRTSLCLLAAVSGASAFLPGASTRRMHQLSMSAENLIGALPPVGYFDPLGISNGKTPDEIKKFREAEIKHGRVAMLAALGIFVGESFNPLFDGKITGPAIFQFQQADALIPQFWVIVLFFIALVEGQTIITGWESLAESGKRKGGVAVLKQDYTPGDIGFDPLGLKPSDSAALEEISTKEIQNGRLAMLGVAGIIAQELVDGKGVLEHYFS
jgi:hypothetical protein